MSRQHAGLGDVALQDHATESSGESGNPAGVPIGVEGLAKFLRDAGITSRASFREILDAKNRVVHTLPNVANQELPAVWARLAAVACMIYGLLTLLLFCWIIPPSRKPCPDTVQCVPEHPMVQIANAAQRPKP